MKITASPPYPVEGEEIMPPHPDLSTVKGDG